MKSVTLRRLLSPVSLTPWRLRLRSERVFPSRVNQFLKLVPGVIHVGANTGSERNEYAKHRLRVVWIEPIPEIFTTLTTNIRGCPDQVALNALVNDRDDVEYAFHVSNNGGLSSSIFDLGLHRE